MIVNDETGGVVVGKLLIEPEAELGKKVHRLFNVSRGHVDEDLSSGIGCHLSSQ